MQSNVTTEMILSALNTHYCESIFITDGDGVIIFVNELGAQRLGVAREKLMYKNVRDLVEEGVYGRSTTLMAIETKEECIARLNPDDRESTVSHSVPLLDENGEVIMVVTNNMSLEHSGEWESILKNERQIAERLRRELDNLKLQSDERDIVIESPEMRRIYDTIEVIAPTDSNIIILGESGTGKDVMARYIHERSNRAEKPFISINCSAIPDTLLESELFGYEGGAFSGALTKGKIGLFEAASGGTIFLDEIGDMPLALQAKLLRTLENHEIRRVGGVAIIPIDVRVICATNADLNAMIQAKEFREDLYYRLSVFTLHLPPLRERKEDILPLAESFLRRLNEKYNTNKYFSKVTVQTMKDHLWPGNIRELRNVVERIFVVSEGDELDFSPKPTAEIPQEQGEVFQNKIDIGRYDTLKDFVEAAEELYIQAVLKECGGSMSQAAQRLGIHRSALYRKLHKK